MRRASATATMAPLKTKGAVVAAISVSVAVLSYMLCKYKSKKKSFPLSKNKKTRNGLVYAVGNTPMIRINSLSEATGCEVSLLLRKISISNM